MSTIILRSSRVSQPSPSTPINWQLLGNDAFVYHPGDPFALRFADKKWVGTEGNNNGSTVYGAPGVGRTWSGTGVNAGLEFGNVQPFNNNSAYTVLVFGAPVAESSSSAVIGQRYSAAPYYIHASFGFNRRDINTSQSGSINVASFFNATGRNITAQNQIDGKPHVWVASNSTSNGFIYRDGVKQSLSINERLSALSYVDAAAKFEIGSTPDSTAAAGNHHPVFLIIGWPRQISETLAASLSANPWQIFE